MDEEEIRFFPVATESVPFGEKPGFSAMHNFLSCTQ